MQDLSGIGTCSLSVALPVLSAMGHKTVALADAVLSSHTKFPHPVIHDLTSFCAETTMWLEANSVLFDAVYIGYMPNVQQIEIAQRLCALARGDALTLIDPCMADHGCLYRGLEKEYPLVMRKLCTYGKILTPNTTELWMLTGIRHDLKAAVLSLVDQNTQAVIVTGVEDESGNIGILGYEVSDRSWFSYAVKKIPQSFSGTGDLWTAVFLGSLLRGKTCRKAAIDACDFVERVLRRSDADDAFGICFEDELHTLYDKG